MRRVVVTGMGAVTPIGIGVEAFWEGLKQGRTGFAPITRFDASEYKCSLAAEVRDFDPEKYMDKKTARRMEQFCQFAVAAAGEAIADAGLNLEQEDPWRVGCRVCPLFISDAAHESTRCDVVVCDMSVRLYASDLSY